MPVGNKNAIIAGCGTHHIAVQTRDWDKSLSFYRDLLGMEITAEFGSPERKILLLDTGDGSFIELFGPTEDTAAPGSEAPNDPLFHFALATTDTAAATERVRQAGYQITVEPKRLQLTERLEVTISFCVGPSGEVIEFFQTH